MEDSGIKLLSRATSSDKKNAGGNGNLNKGEVRKFSRVTSGFVGMNKNDKLGYTLKLTPSYDS